MITSANPWIAHHRANPHARLRLFCIPYAGGGASVYSKWSSLLPATIEVVPVQLPGRENRLLDAPMHDLPEVVKALAKGLLPMLDRPFAFFGHSMGGHLGFELAHLLEECNGLVPRHLFVSASPAPHMAYSRINAGQLPTPELVTYLRTLGGTPEAVLQNPELMELMLPAIRADFTVCNTYRYRPGQPLSCPVTAFGGLQDRTVGISEVDGWRSLTRDRFGMAMFEGDHFYLFESSTLPLVLARVARELCELPAQAV